MTAFVILAAGRGMRIGRAGEHLHKALVPLGQKAVISHLIDLAPEDARICICLGHRSEQVMEYVELAHPRRNFTFTYVDGWDKPGGGPGASLLAARAWVGDDGMVFTSCDTVWERDETLWAPGPQSWAAVAPIPAGTPPERWCVMLVNSGFVDRIRDKEHVDTDLNWQSYTGLACIREDDLPAFWRGVDGGNLVGNELQVTGGLRAINLGAREIRWTDVGTADAYSDAVRKYTGYDFTKLDEATYVLPEVGRVIKWWAEPCTATRRHVRAQDLEGAVPDVLGYGENMLAYRYTPGITCYTHATKENLGQLVDDLWAWAHSNLWHRLTKVTRPSEATVTEAALRFYRDKTYARIIGLLSAGLANQASDAIAHVDFHDLADGVVLRRFHGDFNFGNVLVTDDGFVGIDWREDFADHLDWGDWRYDVGKLLAGGVVHWERAQRGDFRPWELGPDFRELVLSYCDRRQMRDVQLIGALSLLNSAPLHAAPLDEVCVARGCAWLRELT